MQVCNGCEDTRGLRVKRLQGVQRHIGCDSARP